MPAHPHHLHQLEAAARETLASNRSIAVVGIGAELRADDVAGVLVARRIAEESLPSITGIDGSTAPENVTGEIIGASPALVVFIDAAEMGLKPGEVRIIPLEEIEGFTFCTHTLPLSVILSYLASSLNATFMVVGIQPKDTSVLGGVSPEVERTVEEIAGMLAELSRRSPS